MFKLIIYSSSISNFSNKLNMSCRPTKFWISRGLLLFDSLICIFVIAFEIYDCSLLMPFHVKVMLACSLICISFRTSEMDDCLLFMPFHSEVYVCPIFRVPTCKPEFFIRHGLVFSFVMCTLFPSVQHAFIELPVSILYSYTDLLQWSHSVHNVSNSYFVIICFT
jgi:hypothetical protein